VDDLELYKLEFQRISWDFAEFGRKNS